MEEPPDCSQAKKLKNAERSLKLYISYPNRDPLIGLQHVIENTSPESTDPRFTCELCEYRSDLDSLIEHLNSFEHRKSYIAKEYPFLLRVPPAQNEDRVTFLRRMALDIERDEGVKMYRSEVLKEDALQFLETFEIDSDEEALLVMTLTQTLSDNLKTFCLQRTESVKTNVPAQVNSVSQPFGQPVDAGTQPSSMQNQQAPIDTQNRKWNQQAQLPAGSGNLSQDDTVRGLIPQAHYASGHAVPFSVERSGDSLRYTPNGNQPPVYGSVSNDSELRPFAPNETRGPGGFSSANRVYGNEYNLSDRGPRPGSLPGRPLPIDRLPEYPDYRRNPITPSLDSARSANWIQEPSSRYVRDQGPRYTNVSEGYSSGSNTRMMPDAFASQQEAGLQKYLPPKSAAPFRTSFPSDLYRERPRSMTDLGRPEKWQLEYARRYMREFPERAPLDPSVHNTSSAYSDAVGARMLPASAPLRSSTLPRMGLQDVPTQGATSGLAADILTLIKGKDVKAASKILTTLAPTHPALKKVNIANLLNLLVQTGTIK
ncbi:uncharacterized protein [Ambystoma mexicanum]